MMQGEDFLSIAGKLAAQPSFNVQAAVMRATELASRIKACSSGTIRNQIEQGMRAYRRQIKEE